MSDLKNTASIIDMINSKLSQFDDDLNTSRKRNKIKLALSFHYEIFRRQISAKSLLKSHKRGPSWKKYSRSGAQDSKWGSRSRRSFAQAPSPAKTCTSYSFRPTKTSLRSSRVTMLGGRGDETSERKPVQVETKSYTYRPRKIKGYLKRDLGGLIAVV